MKSNNKTNPEGPFVSRHGIWIINGVMALALSTYIVWMLFEGIAARTISILNGMVL